MASDTPSAPRRHRYGRSSTVSVTQLLQDSCSNLIHRIATRVRGPSQTNETPVSTTTTVNSSPKFGRFLSTNTERQLHPLSHSSSKGYFSDRHERRWRTNSSRLKLPEESGSSSCSNLNNSLHNISSLGVTRSRLEDKYSNILEKYESPRLRSLNENPSDSSRSSIRKKSICDKYNSSDLAPSTSGLSRLSTTREKTRDKTPYAGDHLRRSIHRPSTSRMRQKSGLFSTYSSTNSASTHSHLDNIANDENIANNNIPSSSRLQPSLSRTSMSTFKPLDGPENKMYNVRPLKSNKSEAKATPTKQLDHGKLSLCKKTSAALDNIDNLDPVVSEREAKRKEIQSLIMKYAALEDETDEQSEPTPSAITKCQQKYSSILAATSPSLVSSYNPLFLQSLVKKLFFFPRSSYKYLFDL